MMVLPALLGYWADQKLGTIILFTFLGLILGMTGAIWQLVQLVSGEEFQTPESDQSSGRPKTMEQDQKEANAERADEEHEGG